jgi:hypothetical protein
VDNEKIDWSLLAWKIVFNEEPEQIPDPNRPENLPYILAKKRERIESLERFISGTGRVLFEQWRVKIKKGLLALLVSPDDGACHCSSCILLRQLRMIFELLLEAQRVLEDKPKEKGD